MWEFFALSAALAWAIATVLDKVLLERHIPSGNVYLILHGFIGMLPVIGMLILGHRFQFDDVAILGLAVLAGILESVFVWLYYRALQITDASMVAIFLQGVPVMAILISLVFFRENLLPVTCLGIALVVLGTVLAILVGSSGRHRMEWKAIGIVLPALLVVSVSYSLQSYTLRFVTVNDFFCTARLGQLGFGMTMLLFPRIRREWLGIIPLLRQAILIIAIAIGLLSVLGAYLLNQAYALGSFALVTTLSSIQPILILLLVSLVNSIRPRAIPDEGSREFFWRRVAATVFVIVGILISLS